MEQPQFSRRKALQMLGSLPTSSFVGQNKEMIASAMSGPALSLPELGKMLQALRTDSFDFYFTGMTPFDHRVKGWTKASDVEWLLQKMAKFAASLSQVAAQPKGNIDAAMQHWKNYQFSFHTDSIRDDREEISELRQKLASISRLASSQSDIAEILEDISGHEEAIEGSFKFIEFLEKSTPQQMIADWIRGMDEFAVNSGKILEDPSSLPKLLNDLDTYAQAIKARIVPDEIYNRLQRISSNKTPVEDALKTVFDCAGGAHIKSFVNEMTQGVYFTQINPSERSATENFKLLQHLFEDFITHRAGGWNKMELHRQGNIIMLRPSVTARADEVEGPMNTLMAIEKQQSQEVASHTLHATGR